MIRPTAAALLAVLIFPAHAVAQHHEDDDHHHGTLHFTHPLVTESPSPDTKARVDQLWYRLGEGVEGRVARVEVEEAFAPWISLAATLPYEWHTRPSEFKGSGVGSTELSLKAVSYSMAERGLLWGGGLSTSLPTGSDRLGIGSNHAIELEPYAHAAWMHDELEVVGFVRYSTFTRLQPGEENERELTGDGSVLYHIGEHVQVLLEAESARALAGPERGHQVTSLAPGLEIRPIKRPLMLGVSFAAGVAGETNDHKQLLFSAFYHF